MSLILYEVTAGVGLARAISLAVYVDYVTGSSLMSDYSAILMVAGTSFAIDVAIQYLGSSKDFSAMSDINKIAHYAFLPAAAYYFFGVRGLIPLAGAFVVPSIVESFVSPLILAAIVRINSM